MNVNTIVVSREEAQAKLEQYKRVIEKKRVPEDAKLQSLYAAVSKGARVLNLTAAMKQGGVNEKGGPRLAISRVDYPDVGCRRLRDGSAYFWNGRDVAVAKTRRIEFPAGTFDFASATDVHKRLYSPAPHIPPDCRPRFGLHNYHILFEVKEWALYPVDPFLLRRISGMLFVVEAEWELTPLEASLLESMQTGN